LFEIANCFLEGVGVKKAPDIAVSYLRFAANMGDLASQEREWQ
jgi:TPR repeat protein